MSPTDIAAWTNIASDLTVMGILGLIVIGVLRGESIWVPGWLYRQAKAKAEYWEQKYLGAVETVKESVSVTRAIVDSTR